LREKGLKEQIYQMRAGAREQHRHDRGMKKRNKRSRTTKRRKSGLKPDCKAWRTELEPFELRDLGKLRL